VGNVDALMISTEAVQDVVCGCFLNWCCGAFAVQRACLEARTPLVCGWDARWFDLAIGQLQWLEMRVLLSLTPALAWLKPRRARSRTAMKNMSTLKKDL